MMLGQHMKPHGNGTILRTDRWTGRIGPLLGAFYHTSLINQISLEYLRIPQINGFGSQPDAVGVFSRCLHPLQPVEQLTGCDAPLREPTLHLS